MKTITKAALSLFVCALFALPQVSLAKKPDRNPSAVPKDCPATALSRCAVELNAAYDLIGILAGNTGTVFLSKNGDQNAAGLQCKVSGADIKLAQDKVDEASFLLYKAKEKIWSLVGQGKMIDAGIEDAIVVAETCINNP